MLLIPFPLLIAEFLIFYFAAKQWGFLNALGIYLLPCVLGFFILSLVGRVAVMSMQSAVMGGKLPANQLLHSAAVFLSGLCFLVPSFTTRVIGVILLLPGLRHIAVWKFKLFLGKRIARGSSGFANGQGPFGFAGGQGGFRFYGFGSNPGGPGFPEDFPGTQHERDVSGSEVLDVTPLKVTYDEKKDDSKKE